VVVPDKTIGTTLMRDEPMPGTSGKKCPSRRRHRHNPHAKRTPR
jgi:hypothetical protein